VLSCLHSLLDEHGVEGYKQRWVNHDFPIEEFERLQNLVEGRRKTQAPM
jgi:hypothetical protein